MMNHKKLKNYLYYLTAIVSVPFLLVSCSSKETGTNQDTIGEINGTINTGNSYDGYYISTASGDTVITSNSFTITTHFNKCIQTFVVNDGENVYLMSRNAPKSNETMEVNAKSTAIALVTMYPLFAPTEVSTYDDLVEYIESSDAFEPYYREVERAVDNRQNIFDENNKTLLILFNNLIEDLCSDVTEEAFDDTLINIINPDVNTRAIYETPRLNPNYVQADISGHTLTLMTVGLTPTYYGTVSSRNGGVQNIALKARSDFGGLDLFIKTASNWRYGDPMKYTFSNYGEHYFTLSRTTPEATADFYLRLANSLLTAFGIDLKNNDIAQEIGNCICRAMINAGSGVSDVVIDPMEWVGIAYSATLDYLKKDALLGLGIDSFVFGAKFLAGALNWYNKIKGVGNAATRLAYALKAPTQFSFCLCNYGQEVTTCSQASLELISGDNQDGYYKQKLLEPLVVYVSTIDENGQSIDITDFHRVKFEITKGGGKVDDEIVNVDDDHMASTYWTLGESGSQEVKAVVVDVITGKEISNPVYFTSDVEEAEITVRLDWSQHSGNTDIDLHVVDPNGERICYYNMRAASGGFLDRDDRHGPGPEHIHWDNAIPGTYQIYVHYYPNNDEDKSVVWYKVSVTASNKTFRPVSGSISYNQMVPIGQIIIGEEQSKTKADASLLPLYSNISTDGPKKERP